MQGIPPFLNVFERIKQNSWFIHARKIAFKFQSNKFSNLTSTEGPRVA